MPNRKVVKVKSNARRHKSQLRKLLSLRLLAIISVWGVYCFFVATLIQPSTAQDGGGSDGEHGGKGGESTEGSDTKTYWRKGYDGHGTTHEQLGQAHFPAATYTYYVSAVNYSKAPPYSSAAMHPFYNFTHLLFDNILTIDQALPPGYLVVRNGDTLALGPKVEQNDWRDLLAQYWVVWLWILFWLILIVLIPFIAVCYFCFCFCRRCSQGCPPCDHKRDECLRCCYGFVLLVLTVLLLIGIVIAFVTNKLLDRGFQETSMTMRRGSEDTCKYLKDVGDHVYHVFVNNYQELETHLIHELNEAHKHIFLDVADTSESKAAEDLERILLNMPEALKLMRQVDKLEKDIRFYAAQLRDALRGVKRDVNYSLVNLCGHVHCMNFLKNNELEYLDTEKGLHLDKVPNATVYVDAIEEIIENNYLEIPQKVIERMKTIADTIKELLLTVIKPIENDLNNGRQTFHDEAAKIRAIIDSAISDIHLNTLRSTKSFEDVYDKFGPDRNVISIIVCLILILILVILVISLLFGCCGMRRRGYGDDCCNKGTGASCLLLAIILIFTVFSVIALIGLFYFVLGLVTYHGACAPLRDKEKNALFRQLDSSIDLNRYLPKNGDNPIPKLRISTALRSCEANETIFELLRKIGAYDVDDIRRVKVVTSTDGDEIKFETDLSKVILITDPEIIKLNEMRNGNLSSYHSRLFTENISKKFSPVPLKTLAQRLRDLSSALSFSKGATMVSSYNDALHLRRYHDTFVTRLESDIDKIRIRLSQIDNLILYENLPFGESMEKLINAIIKSQKFVRTRGKEYIESLTQNLTQYIDKSISDYIEYVIKEANGNVGHCAPLSYIYNRGVELICYRLVDPMNGFWLGVLLCCLLFLPILWVAHKLMCLYRRIDPYIAGAAAGGGAGAGAGALVEGGCPICTGAPYVPPPVLTCGGGQQAHCSCHEGAITRGGALSSTKQTAVQKAESHGKDSSNNSSEHEHTTKAGFRKRKQD